MQRGVLRRVTVAALGALLGLAGPAIAAEADPLPVEEVAAGVFVYQAPYELASAQNLGMVGNCGFVVGGAAVAVIDSGGSARGGARLRAAIRARTPKPIRYVINTHVHPDHLLGNAAFTGAEVVGAATLPEALAARAESYLAATERLIGGPAFAGTAIVPAGRLVDGTVTLDLGGRRLRLERWPTAHSNSDLTVFDEATDTWFLGDLVFVGHVPALDGRLAGWIDTLDRLRARSAALVVPGHGPASLPWPQGGEDTARYLAVLRDEGRALLRDGIPIEQATRAGEGERGRWSLFDAFHARNAVAAYQELEWE